MKIFRTAEFNLLNLLHSNLLVKMGKCIFPDKYFFLKTKKLEFFPEKILSFLSNTKEEP